jgi:hypothetical protein
MSISAEMKFSEAASSWLDMRDAGSSRARYLKPRTLKTYRLELDALALRHRIYNVLQDSPYLLQIGSSRALV